MAFTDDDLKRLKEMLFHKCEGEDNPPPMPFNGSPIEKMKALLARLEAAEDAVEQAYRCTSENRNYYDKWRKAKGE